MIQHCHPRESGDPGSIRFDSDSVPAHGAWIPAFAGMTKTLAVNMQRSRFQEGERTIGSLFTLTFPPRHPPFDTA